MPTNQEILRTVITTGDQGTPGAGLLSPEQFLAFYELAQVDNPWMALQNLERRKAHSGGVPRIDFGGDVITAATEAVDSGVFNKPSHSNVPYNMVKGRVAHSVSNEGVSQSADPNYQEKLVNGFTVSWGRSHQKLSWNGDTTSVDTMLKLNDGWLKQMAASGNPVAGAAINAGVVNIEHFQSALEALPEAWQQRQSGLKWGMTSKKWNQYARSLSGRATAGGDAAIEKGANGFPLVLGMEVIPVPSLTGTPDDDKIVLADPRNTTNVMDPRQFSLKKVDTGITAVGQDIMAWFGFYHSDHILLEVEGTAIVSGLTN